MDCEDYVKHFKFHVSQVLCIDNNENAEIISIILGCMCVVLSFICFLLYKRADVVINKITSVNENLEYDQTYCTLTLDIAKNTKIMICVSGLLLLPNSIEFIVGDKY